MKIELRGVTVGELIDGYQDDGEDGVVGYHGRLNIRPPYQREFIYKPAQRDAVIDTTLKGFPLNTMYWVKNEGDCYELMDGQQRTVSLCQFTAGGFTIENNGLKTFFNLTPPERRRILDYKLQIYVCEGDARERLDWFRIINIAGERLTEQELRNAQYTGPWLRDAKGYFSRTGAPAVSDGRDKYVAGAAIRQEVLEAALAWIHRAQGLRDITDYMSAHQHDADAQELWQYWQAVFDWVERVFPVYRREMKGLPWGLFYNAHKDDSLNARRLEERIAGLMRDDDVTNKKGVYAYALDHDEKHLNIRAFTDNMKREAWERQAGVCPVCGGSFDLSAMEADHIDPWHSGGKTNAANCQMLCKPCNRRKSGK